METQVPGHEFRILLRQTLKQAADKNPSFSLRAFAKKLNISASSLSMVMSGKCPVTLSFIEKVAGSLNLDESKISYYQINLLKEKIARPSPCLESIDQIRFSIIKEWYHYAILNLMRTKDFKPKPQWIAKRLAITLGEVQTAIDNLQQAGFLKIEGGRWQDISPQFTTHENPIFSKAAKENQTQLFTKALDSIEQIDFANRSHTGSTIALKKKDLEKAKDFIRQFRKEFMKEFDNQEHADEVYHLSVGLFPLSHLK